MVVPSKPNVLHRTEGSYFVLGYNGMYPNFRTIDALPCFEPNECALSLTFYLLTGKTLPVGAKVLITPIIHRAEY